MFYITQIYIPSWRRQRAIDGRISALCGYIVREINGTFTTLLACCKPASAEHAPTEPYQREDFEALHVLKFSNPVPVVDPRKMNLNSVKHYTAKELIARSIAAIDKTIEQLRLAHMQDMPPQIIEILDLIQDSAYTSCMKLLTQASSDTDFEGSNMDIFYEQYMLGQRLDVLLKKGLDTCTGRSLE